MTGRQLIVLSLAALIVGLVALLAQREQGAEHAPQARTRLYPGLEARLNEVTAIAIVPPGGPAIHIEREGQDWKVRERWGYPADLSRIREALIKLARLERLEPKTRVPQRYARLGVQGPDENGGSGTEIRLMDKEGQVLTDLIIGKRAEGGGYVRPKDDAQSWLVAEHIVLATRPQDWLDKTLLQIPLERIGRVDRHPPGGPDFSVVHQAGKGSTDDLTLEPIPEGRRPRPRELRRLASALGELRLTDVHPESQDRADGMPWDLTTYTTRDGLIVEAHTRIVDRKARLRLSVHPDGAADATPEARDRLEKEATRLQKRFDGWTYEIPSYKATSLTLSLEAVTEPEQSETPKAAPPASQGKAMEAQPGPEKAQPPGTKAPAPETPVTGPASTAEGQPSLPSAPQTGEPAIPVAPPPPAPGPAAK